MGPYYVPYNNVATDWNLSLVFNNYLFMLKYFRRLYPDISFFQLPTLHPCRDYKGICLCVVVVMMGTNRNCNGYARIEGKSGADNFTVTNSGIY